jgi:hypothetical protein
MRPEFTQWHDRTAAVTDLVAAVQLNSLGLSALPVGISCIKPKRQQTTPGNATSPDTLGTGSEHGTGDQEGQNEPTPEQAAVDEKSVDDQEGESMGFGQ